MVHVATELEKSGLDIPLLIGGATTSRLHTALKIAPVYHAPVVHLKDASQNATVAAKLMNPKTKEELEGKNWKLNINSCVIRMPPRKAIPFHWKRCGRIG